MSNPSTPSEPSTAKSESHHSTSSSSTRHDAAQEEREKTATVIGMAGAGRNVSAAGADTDSEGDEVSTADDDLDRSNPSGRDTTSDANNPKQKSSGRKLPAFLLILLLASVAMNFWQVEQRQGLSQRSVELDLALDRAMERVDSETGRANLAEGTLSEIDRSVDNVQERISDLQSALSNLSKAAAR